MTQPTPLVYRPDLAETPIHFCPPGSEPLFPCCGPYVQEHHGDRMTLDADLVTCRGR